MTFVCVASARGAPGATTLACLLANAWPGTKPRYVVEADPAGGVLAARWHEAAGLTWEPGILELSASRGTIGAAELAANAQPVNDSTSIIAARPLGMQVEAALANLGADGAGSLGDPGAVDVVVADLGRITTGNSTLVLARSADIVLVVFRPWLEQAQAVLNTTSHLHAEGVHVGLVGVGRRPYTAAEVAEQAGVDFVAEVPDDHRSARTFRTQGFSWRGLSRSPLARATNSLANELARHCADAIAADDTTDRAVQP